jgi:hypothetical protein
MNRTAWVCETPEMLIQAEDAARKQFGKPIRCKNHYDPSFNAVKETKGYRTTLCNYVYSSGMTWGDLAEETRAATTKVIAHVHKAYWHAGGFEASGLWWILKRCNLICEHMLSVQRDDEAKIIVEIQFMLREYTSLRKKSHPWYKLSRAATPFGLHGDHFGAIDDM